MKTTFFTLLIATILALFAFEAQASPAPVPANAVPCVQCSPMPKPTPDAATCDITTSCITIKPNGQYHCACRYEYLISPFSFYFSFFTIISLFFSASAHPSLHDVVTVLAISLLMPTTIPTIPTGFRLPARVTESLSDLVSSAIRFVINGSWVLTPARRSGQGPSASKVT